MSVTITGKLNKAASQFQAGESTGFGIRLGVKYYDRETKQNEWTNYECAVFAKAPGQVQFYQSALVEGAIVEITGGEQKIRQFDGNNGPVLSIEIMGAKLGFVGQSAQAPAHPQQHAPQQQQAPNHTRTAPHNQQYQPPQPQGGFQQPSQPLQQPGANDFSGFDDDIQF